MNVVALNTATMRQEDDANRRRVAILEVLKEKDWSAADLIKRSGISPNTLYGFLRGRTNSITIPNLQKMADAANVPLSRLTGEIQLQTVETPVIYVRGEVEAGAWREAGEWPKYEWKPLPIPVEDRFRNIAFGLKINGPSMNRVYPVGSTIVCIPIEECPRNLRSGDHVIVQRVSSDGLYETTVKELEFDDEGHPWLWPRSDHPKHQQPIEIPTPELDEWVQQDNREIRIVAVVIGAYQSRTI